MRRFILRSLFFILPIAALLMALEFSLRRIPNDYSFKQERLGRDGSTFQFLVLGNSHAYRGIAPRFMRSVGFNAANISQDHALDHAVLLSHIHDLPNLKYVLLPVSYASIGANLLNGEEAWRMKNYVLYMDLPERAQQLDQRLELLNRPMRGQVHMLDAYWMNGTTNLLCDSDGACLKAKSDTIDMEAYAIKAADRHRANSSTTVKENLEALTEMAELTRTRGIKLILISPPATAAYRDRLDPKQLAEVVRIGEQLAQRYPHVTYHDLLADPRFEFPDFSDADHLGAEGARKLSGILDGYMARGDTLAVEDNNGPTP